MHKIIFNPLKYLIPNGLNTKRESNFSTKQLIFRCYIISKFLLQMLFHCIIIAKCEVDIIHSFIHSLIYAVSIFWVLLLAIFPWPLDTAVNNTKTSAIPCHISYFRNNELLFILPQYDEFPSLLWLLPGYHTHSHSKKFCLSSKNQLHCLSLSGSLLRLPAKRITLSISPWHWAHTCIACDHPSILLCSTSMCQALL